MNKVTVNLKLSPLYPLKGEIVAHNLPATLIVNAPLRGLGVMRDSTKTF
jgi:hypothetical protein